jgi:hypothetical protein
MAEEVVARTIAASLAVKLFIFPAKFFAVPAKYENNVALKF